MSCVQVFKVYESHNHNEDSNIATCACNKTKAVARLSWENSLAHFYCGKQRSFTAK